MAYACKLCIARHRLKGYRIRSLPQTEEQLITHIERVHGIAVRRPAETRAQAEARMRRMHGEHWPYMFMKSEQT